MNQDFYYIACGLLNLSILLVALYLSEQVQTVIRPGLPIVSFFTWSILLANMILFVKNDFDFYEYMVYIKIINNKVDENFLQLMMTSDYLERTVVVD